jgi:hypothetical protein
MLLAAMGMTYAQLLLAAVYFCTSLSSLRSDERRNAEAMNNNDATYVVAIDTATDAAHPLIHSLRS